MAACRLASKGKTMADSSYNLEVQNILSFLKMQHMNPDPQIIEPITTDINPECLVSPRYLKKYKNKQVTEEKLDVAANRFPAEEKEMLRSNKLRIINFSLDETNEYYTPSNLILQFIVI